MKRAEAIQLMRDNPDTKITHEYFSDEEWLAMGKDGYVYSERLVIINQMPSCASCNINKHSMSLEEFRSLIQGFMKHLNELNTQYKIAKRYGLVKENIKPIVFYFEKQNDRD